MSVLLDALELGVERYNHRDYIQHDPIAIPHGYSKLQDIEITAFWTAILSWGLRKTIIAKAQTLFSMMDNAPHQFITQHEERDLIPFLHFKHRTFLPDDTLYFIAFLRYWYKKNESLETAFFPDNEPTTAVEQGLIRFRKTFFSLPEAQERTRKHLSTPESGAACKRLCMFLRWMVRRDDKGFDFGLWQRISPADLIIPLDVHVGRQARLADLLARPKDDWQAALELTERLKMFHPQDPTRYDFALFNWGIAHNLSSKDLTY